MTGSHCRLRWRVEFGDCVIFLLFGDTPTSFDKIYGVSIDQKAICGFQAFCSNPFVYIAAHNFTIEC